MANVQPGESAIAATEAQIAVHWKKESIFTPISIYYSGKSR